VRNIDNQKMTRREVMFRGAQVAAGAALARPVSMLAAATSAPPLIGIQIGAVSFVDEGVNKVLDILQEKGAVNTLFISSFTYDAGTGGRQVKGRPLPDHGKQEYDNFHGGNFATPHARFYSDTVLNDTKAPDHGDLDIFEMVLPEARKRGMKVYAWDYNIFRTDIPHVDEIEEVDIFGNKASTCCALNPDYQHFIVDLIRDHCTSYPIDGVMWGAEQQGPLDNVINSNINPHPGTCFCKFHRKEAAARGIDVQRALEGYRRLAAFTKQAGANQRPVDGYFVEFWRIMVEFPEILAWEKLWNDGKYGTFKDIYKTAKSVRADLQVGFHIWHTASFSPFFRAEQDFAMFTENADYLKPVLYNNCAGPRYASYIDRMGDSIFHDLKPDQLEKMNDAFLNYEGMGLDLKSLPKSGLPAEYVFRETKRSLDSVRGKCKIYPGIDIDIPTALDDKQTSPDDVYGATLAALKAGAEGVILSRKYSEMKLENLAGAGRAVKTYKA